MLGRQQLSDAYQKANIGDVDAQLMVGRHYYQQGDIYQAKSYLERASDKGNKDAQFELAKLLIEEYEKSVSKTVCYQYQYQYGCFGDQTNLSKVIELCQKASDQGVAEARAALQPDSKSYKLIAQYAEQHRDKTMMFHLGYMHNAGKYVPCDVDKAVVWYRKAADLGCDSSANSLGCIYYNRGDHKLAFQCFEKAARGWNTYARCNLGEMYQEGEGTTKDLRRAEQCYREAIAVKRDYASPYYRLGQVYEVWLKEAGSPRQYSYEYSCKERHRSQMLENYQEAARLGHTSSQSCLGVIYYQDQKYPDAAKYFGQAIEKDVTAQYYWAKMHDLGQGVQKNPDIAFTYYQKTAQAGNKDAQYELGCKYETRRDWVLAFEWFLKASTNNTLARQKLDRPENTVAKYNKLYLVLDKDMAQLRRHLQLMKAIGYTEFCDPRLFIRALTRTPDPATGEARFERLEFVGDRVLNLVAADIIEQRAAGTLRVDQLNFAFRKLTENHGILCVIAREIRLGEYLIDEHIQSGQPVSENMLADAMEAIMAAVYRDIGFDATRAIVANLFQPHIGPVLREAEQQQKPLVATQVVAPPSPASQPPKVPVPKLASAAAASDGPPSPRTRRIFCSLTRHTTGEEFEAVVKQSSNVNCRNEGKKGDTPLMTLLRRRDKLKSPEISKIEILVRHGALWQATNKQGQTAEAVLREKHKEHVSRFMSST